MQGPCGAGGEGAGRGNRQAAPALVCRPLGLQELEVSSIGEKGEEAGRAPGKEEVLGFVRHVSRWRRLRWCWWPVWAELE